ncbi:helix-turn-helix domain-containing protein [Actinophytocola oryzae]|uniref:AraC family transcriptional regulator n=1 Tax=Actinophytocola oryzae TaxID=502181 RepID=A0A4R7V7U7_9PSEU|nr:helix-turn-helix transcriptional regulator [Actinophytocola oryzae]TDV44295.1 AraC family transcriptional regulator [Actinophytocola oryzae]
MRHAEPDLRGYAVTHPPGPLTPPQAAEWHQLIYATSGVLVVDTPEGRWTLPRHRALWVSAGIVHTLRVIHRSALRILYTGERAQLLPDGCRVLDVSPLLRELVVHLVEHAPLHLADPRHARLVAVLRDLLADLPADAALLLPTPVDPRAVAASELVTDLDVAALCRRVGVGRRTLERLFLAETGMSVGQWRRRRRMLDAVAHLAGGLPVADIAQRVGYTTPSAFSAAFRAELGVPPSRWQP